VHVSQFYQKVQEHLKLDVTWRDLCDKTKTSKSVVISPVLRNVFFLFSLNFYELITNPTLLEMCMLEYLLVFRHRLNTSVAKNPKILYFVPCLKILLLVLVTAFSERRLPWRPSYFIAQRNIPLGS